MSFSRNIGNFKFQHSSMIRSRQSLCLNINTVQHSPCEGQPRSLISVIKTKKLATIAPSENAPDLEKGISSTEDGQENDAGRPNVNSGILLWRFQKHLRRTKSETKSVYTMSQEKPALIHSKAMKHERAGAEKNRNKDRQVGKMTRRKRLKRN